MALRLFAVVVLGLMCGSELNVALFSHPLLKRESFETHIPVRSSLAALLGRVMPFWMVSSLLLNFLLLLPFGHLKKPGWSFAAIALGIQILAVAFSLIGPVPINNRIAKWTASSLPNNWKAQEARWDRYHLFRTCGLIVGFVLLVLSISIG